LGAELLFSACRGLLAAGLFATLAFALPVAAQDSLLGAAGQSDQPFDLTADTVEFEPARGVYVARGNVRITQPTRTLTADWVSFSNVTRQGVAMGDVVVVERADTLYADVLHFEVDTLQGIVYQARLDARDSDFTMTGEEIRKTGEQTYVFVDASFTTCRCPEDDWRLPWLIRASDADLEIGGYATTRNTTFEVLGVPILWLPWMRYPVKTERETGFLFPSWSQSSRAGFDIGLPFFWAARDNINVTVTPRYLTKRGFKPELDVEYVFGRRSLGELYATFISDKEIDERDLSSPFSKQRWAVEWVHDHHLPDDWRFKVDSRFFSDNRYAFDFRDFSNFRNDRYLEALGFVEKRFGLLGRYGLTGAVHFADDIQNPDDQDRDDFLLHRMPDLRLAGLPQPILRRAPRLVASFDTRYTHFYSLKRAARVLPEATVVGDGVFLDTGIDAIPDGRERDAFGRNVRLDGTVRLPDGRVLTAAEYTAAFPQAPPLALDGSGDNFPPGPEGDGRFQEGEPLGDRGHRFVMNPRLAYPLRIADVVELVPEIGWHGTAYQTQEQGGEFRSLFTAQIDARARLRRVIDLPWAGRAVHLMEPRLAYTGITSDSQRGNPLFIPRPGVMQKRVRQLDLWNVIRDPSDRIEAVNALTVGFGNRIYVPSLAEEAPPRLFADVTFSFQEDFESAEFRSLFVDGRLFPTESFSTRFNLGWDFDEGRLGEALIQGGYSTPEGYDFRLTYRYLRDVPRFFENFRFDTERFDEFEAGFLRINQLSFFMRLALTRNWGVTYRIVHSFEESLILANQLGIEYISRCLCWAVRLELEDDRTGGFGVSFQYRLIGLGDDTVRPFQRRRARREGRDPLIDEGGI
jgi:lipopolysaccharide assembly outer membrane protein LptD (OstA)